MKALLIPLVCAAALLLPSCFDFENSSRVREDFAERSQMADSSIIKGWLLPGTRNIRLACIREWQDMDVFVRYDAPASPRLREELLALLRAPQKKDVYTLSEEKAHRVSRPEELWMSSALRPAHQGCAELDFWVFAPDAAGEEIELTHPGSLTRVRLFLDETHGQIYLHMSK